MWDEPALRRVLNWTAELGEALEQNAERVHEHARLVQAARAQARPHPVSHQEVTLHQACAGAGCAPCGRSGVVHESGAPFIAAQPARRPAYEPPPPSPPTRAELDKMRRTLEQARQAHERMTKLAQGFELLAGRLERAAALARQLAADLTTILGGKAP